MIVLPVPLNWKHAQQPQKCKISPLFFVSFTWLTHPLTPWGLFMQAESRSPYLGIYPPSVMIIYLRLLKEKVWFCKIPYFFSLRKARSWICLLWQKMCLPYDLKELCVKSVCVYLRKEGYSSGKRYTSLLCISLSSQPSLTLLTTKSMLWGIQHHCCYEPHRR